MICHEKRIKPIVKETTVKYKNPYITVVADDLVFERTVNGKTETLNKEYFSLDCPDFVVGIVVKDDKLLMVNQYRHPIRETNTEFIAGQIEEGESADDAIRKELLEEGGIIANEIIYLGKINPLSGQMNNHCFVYLIKDFSETESKLEEYEIFTGLMKVWVPISSFRSSIKNGRFIDGVSLAAWCLFLENNY